MASPTTGASAQFIDKPPSALCTTGLKPLNLNGILLWLLRRHFSVSSYIVQDSLKEYIWAEQPSDSRENVSDSKIMIESVTKVTGVPSQFIQQRPAVLVKRNRFAPAKLGLGDKWQGFDTSPDFAVNPDTGYALDTGEKYEIMIVGSHTAFCIGGTSGEAEAVATEVFFELVEFAPLIRKDFGFNQFKVNEMGAPNRLEESKEHWVVPIVMSYTFFHGWTLRPETAFLKGTGISV